MKNGDEWLSVMMRRNKMLGACTGVENDAKVTTSIFVASLFVQLNAAS